jgi:hypothetical protein
VDDAESRALRPAANWSSLAQWEPPRPACGLYGLTESFPSAKNSPRQTNRRRAAPRDRPPHGLKKQKIGPQRQNVPSGTPWKIWIL